jgi:hypothetical protein
MSEDQVFGPGAEAVRGGGGGGQAWKMEGSAFYGRSPGAANGFARYRREGRGDGVIGFREDQVAGMQMDGGGGEQSFARRGFRFSAKGAIERAAVQDESVELLELAVREERVFSQAGILRDWFCGNFR